MVAPETSRNVHVIGWPEAKGRGAVRRAPDGRASCGRKPNEGARMLKIAVIAPGKLKERFWKDGCAEYLKRLSGYAKVTVRELADSTPEQEEKLIFGAIEALPRDTRVVLLDIGGDLVTSEELSRRLDDMALRGTSSVAFVIVRWYMVRPPFWMVSLPFPADAGQRYGTMIFPQTPPANADQG